MAYFRDKFRAVFQVQESPHRVALAFAFGVFMGISPFFGLHYAAGIFLAWLFRLNKLVAIIGISINNPWTIVPISTFSVWIGTKLLGIKEVLPVVDWANISLLNVISRLSDLESFIYMFKRLLPLIASFFVGSMALCSISAVASYFIIQLLVTRYRKTTHVP